MSSKIEIVNAALVKLGASTINSFTESSTESIAANALWTIALKSTLREYPWKFATKRSNALARINTSPEWKYDYLYALPSDCLRLMKVDLDDDYRLEGRNIVTNKKECFIKYVYYNEDTSLWDASFTELMVVKMAFELAYTLPRAGTMIDRMETLYRKQLIEARDADSSEQITDTLGQFESALISARNYS